jgi:hypothetical protein
MKTYKSHAEFVLAMKLISARIKMGGLFGFEGKHFHYRDSKHTDIRKTFAKHIPVEAF